MQRIEPMISFLTEMSKLILETTDIYGIKPETGDTFLGIMNISALSIEQLKLAKILNNHEEIAFFIRHVTLRPEDSRSLSRKQLINSTDFISLHVEIMNYLREYGDWSFSLYKTLEDFQKLLILHFYQERIPASLAVEMIRLAYETGDREILDYFSNHYDGYLQEMVDPKKSISVDLAVELVKLAREKGDRNTLDYFEPYLHEKLKERNEVPTTLVIEVIKLVREVSDQKTLMMFLEKYVLAIASVRSIPVALFVELVKISDMSINQATLERLTTYCNNIIIGKRYIPHELAIAMIKLARRADERDILNHFGEDYLTDILQTQQSVPVELAIELIKLALENQTQDQVGIESFYHKYLSLDRCYLDLLPVDTLVDLQQLAQKFDDEELLRKIEKNFSIFTRASSDS